MTSKKLVLGTGDAYDIKIYPYVHCGSGLQPVCLSDFILTFLPFLLSFLKFFSYLPHVSSHPISAEHGTFYWTEVGWTGSLAIGYILTYTHISLTAQGAR